MNQPAVFRGDLTPVLDGETFLAPCVVRGMSGADAEVERPDGEVVTARLAVAFSFAPAPGDELLVIGRDGAFFAIGVLQTQGEMRIDFPGDVRVRSEGDLELEAREGLELSSERIELSATKVRLVADVVKESARELYTNVREVLSVRAGEKREDVRGAWNARSESASITTRADVTVNGEQIRLG